MRFSNNPLKYLQWESAWMKNPLIDSLEFPDVMIADCFHFIRCYWKENFRLQSEGVLDNPVSVCYYWDVHISEKCNPAYGMN